MNWYKKSQEQITSEIPLTNQDVKQALDRYFNANKETIKDFYDAKDYYDARNIYDALDVDELSLMLESDTDLYYRYWKFLPENVTVADAIQAYRDKKLKDKTTRPQIEPLIDFKNIKPLKTKKEFPFSKKTPEQKEQDIIHNWSIATQKFTKEKQQERLRARYQIFLAWSSNKQTADILGISKSELNQKIKQWTNVPLKAITTQDSLNNDVPENIQWHGITNSSFLEKQQIKTEDIDKFVKKITATEQSGWYANSGDILRKYILRSFLAINTSVTYKDLSFLVDSTINFRGEYKNKDKSIYIKETSPHTIAHEIGHYLDHKWAEEAYKNSSSLGITASIMFDSFTPENIKNPLRRQWMKKLYDFIMMISEHSEISSEYYQRRSEVFSRFVAKFINWTNNTAGMKAWTEEYEQDHFTEQQYKQFVRLLQEKSYIDQQEQKHQILK